MLYTFKFKCESCDNTRTITKSTIATRPPTPFDIPTSLPCGVIVRGEMCEGRMNRVNE